MSNREYLNEEKYRHTARRLRIVGLVMIVLGLTGFIGCGILLFGDFLRFEQSGLVGFAWILCMAVFGFGLVVYFTSRQREISAYMIQQQMPVLKETVKELTPLAGETAKDLAPAAGEVAKEIAKGVKEGLKDE